MGESKPEKPHRFCVAGNIGKRFQFTWIGVERALIASAIVYTNSQIRRIKKKKTLSDSSSKKIGVDESRVGEWIHWFHVDERPICVKQYAVSNISRFMWTGGLLRNNFCTRVLPFFFSSIQIFFKRD